MESVKKIDIHAHVTAFPQYTPESPYFKQRFLDGAELIRFYDELNIEKGVLLPIVAPEAQHTMMTTEACMYVADQYPDRFLWFCNVDPRMLNNTPTAALSYLLDYYKSRGAKGMGELTTQLLADDPKLDNLYSCLEEVDLPLTIHIGPHFDGCYGIVDDLGLPRLEKMLKKHPKLKIFGHSQPFWSEISADNTDAVRNINPPGKVIEGRLTYLLRTYENLYCDLSAGSGRNAMMRDPEHAARFMEEFSDRLMYGCDICSVANVHQYQFNDFLNQMLADGLLKEETYRKIVRENAVRLLKL